MNKNSKLLYISFILLFSICNNLYAGEDDHIEYGWGDPRDIEASKYIEGQKGNRVKLFLFSLDTKWPPPEKTLTIEKKILSEPNETILSYVNAAPGLRDIINLNCLKNQENPNQQEQEFAPILGPILAAGGKLAFDLYMDAKIRKNLELQKAAQASYTVKVTLSGSDLKSEKCALIIRDKVVKDKVVNNQGMDNKATLGFLTLVKLENKEQQAFVMSPLYVLANNSVATTKRGEKKVGGEKASINITIAVSTKGIGKQLTGVPGLFAVGEGVFGLANIPIAIDPKNLKDPLIPKDNPYVRCVSDSEKACPKSDLVVYPEGNPVSVSFTVSEAGNIGYDADQYGLELKAIKEAIGPAIKDGLKESFK